jgi:hypothetical protein
MLRAFATIPGLSESDQKLIAQKIDEFPRILAGISEVWASLGDDPKPTQDDLRKLYEVLNENSELELAPFDTLLQALEAPEAANLSAEELDRWGFELDAFSPRVPGTQAMDDTAAYLIEKLESFGIKTWSEPLDFKGVFFTDWSFGITAPTAKVIGSFPQNNVAFGDIAAELVDVGRGHEEDYEGKDVKGKIVFVDWGDIWDQEGPCSLRQRYGLLALYDIAYENGAAGMVGYFDDAPGNALKLVEPGIRPIGGSNIPGAVEVGPDHQFALPVLNIGTVDALALKEELASGTVEAHLVIEGVRKVSTTQSVLGYLPGLSDSAIAVAAHSCTAFEGAICDTVGVVGALAFAKHFASLPLEKRPKSILFFFDSFHVWGNCNQTANLVLRDHADIVENIDAFVWLDHISDGIVDADRILLSSDNPVTWPITALALARNGVFPLAVPVSRIWSMCANGPFERAGIPTLTMQSFGDIVLTTEDTWDKFDPAVVLRDVSVNLDIARAFLELDIPRNEPGEPIGGCGVLFTGLEHPTYAPGESYEPQPSYPLLIGGETGPIVRLTTKEEKQAFFAAARG